VPLLEPTGLPQWYIDCCNEMSARASALVSEADNASNVLFGRSLYGDRVYVGSRDVDDDRVTNLLRDVAFNRHSMNDGQHVSPLDNGRLQVGTDGIIVKLVQGLDEAAFKRTLDMATRATIGMDLSQPIPGDWEPCPEFTAARARQLDSPADPSNRGDVIELRCGHASHRSTTINPGWQGEETSVGLALLWEGQVAGGEWEEMLKGGLQTALESQVIVFAVSGISRTCTHQLVRSRRAAFHQQSQRASFYGVAPEVRMPESVWLNPRARRAALDAYAAAQEAYRIICEEDISYQDARFVLPEGTTNYILCEYNVKEFRDVFAYRGCSMFSWEIVHVMREMRRLLVEAHPFLADLIKISCEKTSRAKDRDPGYATLPGGEGAAHTCTFQGWERVDGQCDFPWARDTNRTFRSATYEIGRKPETYSPAGLLSDAEAKERAAELLKRRRPGSSHPAAQAIARHPEEDGLAHELREMARSDGTIGAGDPGEPRVPSTDSEARRPDHYPGRGGW